MAHLHRFHIPPETALKGRIALPKEEAHHAIHVLRLRMDEPVQLFDGAGRYASARVAALSRREVEVDVEAVCQSPPEPKRLTLLQAALHRVEAVEFILKQGTALGVTQFVFFTAAHSERPLKASPKWGRALIESAKQCGRNWLPSLHLASSLEVAFGHAEGAVGIATQHADPTPLAGLAAEDAATLLIGPEGDFSASELDWALAQGARPLSLGALTLRAEIAAIVSITLLRYHQGALGAVG